MYLIFDTETYNVQDVQKVNVYLGRPFLYSYVVRGDRLEFIEEGWFRQEDIVKKNHFIDLLKQCKVIVGANVKYDLHMCLNDGITDVSFLDTKMYVDIEVLARLVLDCDTQDSPSFSIGLKQLAKKFIGVDSDAEEKQLKHELSQLTMHHKTLYKEHIARLYASLSAKQINTIVTETYDNKHWFKYRNKYKDFLEVERNNFFNAHRRPDYRDCKNVTTYAMTDARLTDKLFMLWFKRIVPLKQKEALVRISGATIPLLVMENEGLVIDVNKLLHDQEICQREYDDTCAKIVDPRTGERISPSQNAKLKEVYEYESGMVLKNCDKNTRKKLGDASPTAELVSYARSIEKYLTTYSSGLLEKLVKVGNEWKLFTQYNQAGTITGRLSSDCQQFPKEPLELKDGTIINIRSWFVIPEGYKYMVYEDYCNMELRLQCEWSALVNNGVPDKTMTRAFTPYDCTQRDGKWYLNESPDIEWHPTDLHSMTAKKSFGVDESDPNWKHYRKLGKTTNFSCNYGCGAATLAERMDIPFEQAEALIKGYKETFKGVTDFGNWLKKRCWTVKEHPNLFYRYYYSQSAFKLANYLVQGSGADILMMKLRETYEWLKKHPHWKYVICVHDELGYAVKDIPFEQMKSEAEELQKVMQVPLTAVLMEVDIEYTTTNWASKKGFDE